MKSTAVRVGKGAMLGAIAAAESLVRRPDLSSDALRGIKNFLVLQYPAALGTAVHATPLVGGLRAVVPGARIVVGASGYGLEVFRNNEALERVIETPSPLNDLWGAVRAVRGVFGGAAYATLTSTGNERTAIGMQALLAGKSVRVGFTVVPQLYHRPLRFDSGLSQIANNLRILKELGHEVGHVEPVIFPSAKNVDSAGKLLTEQGMDDGRPIAVFVTQTSVTQRKGWRGERFVVVARHLREKFGAHILFVGTAAEAGRIDEIRAQLGFASASVAGKTDIGVLGAVLARCAVGVTLDTGTLHIGRGVGLPMVVIAPAWSPAVEWLPVGNPKYKILKNLTIDAPAPADYVIDEVSVAEVCAAVDELMSQRTETVSRSS